MKAKLGKLKGYDLRPTQEQAVKFIKESDKRFIAVRGPTGIGKTCLGFESMKVPFYYVCSSLQLQDQALSDYPEARVLKGRSNYFCPKYETADVCMQPKPCEECDYNSAKQMAIASNMTVLNFHYFLNITNFTKSLEPRNIIIDEADNLENVLVSFISLDFSVDRLKRYGITPKAPSKKTKIEVMPEWINQVHTELDIVEKDMLADVKDILQRIKIQYRQPTAQEIGRLKKYKNVQSLKWKMNFLARQNLLDNWIYKFDDRKKSIILKPKWLTRDMTDTFLFSKCEQILFMSATLPSKEVFCGLYGLEAEELDYVDLPNVWDSEERKIIYKPYFNLSYKNRGEETDRRVKSSVERILAQHPTGRGVIHSVSYALAKLIEDVSDRIIIHGYTDRVPLFEKFMETPDAVWVSPSSTRGIDLPDELCEFILWLKAPFLHIADPQVNARLYSSGNFGRLWYASDAVQTIIQGCGRGFRHENDFCTCYLMDEQIGRLLQKQAKLFPMWFRDLIAFEDRDEGF